MENFTISTQLTLSAYVKLMWIGLYRKPRFIVAAIVGVLWLIKVGLDAADKRVGHAGISVWELSGGIFLLLAPALIVLISAGQFLANPDFRQGLTFSCSESGITTQGRSFKNELAWKQIIRQQEIQQYLVLYYTEKMGYFLDKTQLTTPQLEWIKSKVDRT